MYNYRPRSPSPVRRSASPSRYPTQSFQIAEGPQVSPMMCCLFILIIIIVMLCAGIVILGVFFALSNPECEPSAPAPVVNCPNCPSIPSCPAPPMPVERRLILTPEQVAQHQRNFDQLRDDIIAAEGYYDPWFLHKREYYTRDIMPELTDEQKAMALQETSGCTDQDSFQDISLLEDQTDGQWVMGVEFQPSFESGFAGDQGRKKRLGRFDRSCGAQSPSPLSTCIVRGGRTGSLPRINNFIQWVFHEDCNGDQYSGCSGSCCEIVRYFKAYVFLTGDNVALEKDIEVHTCDCANN